jgi:hypothetical protein
VRKTAGGLAVSETVCRGAAAGNPEREGSPAEPVSQTFYLRVAVSQDAVCRFSYSSNGADFRLIGEPFPARAGRWIGAKVGLFALAPGAARESGYADIDWFRVE